MIKKRKRKKEPGESENRWGIELNLNTVHPPSGTGNNQTPRELIHDNHGAADAAAACMHAPEPALQGGGAAVAPWTICPMKQLDQICCCNIELITRFFFFFTQSSSVQIAATQ